MSDTQFDQKVVESLGLDGLSPEEQEVVFARIGGLLLDAAIGRLLLSLDDEQVQILQTYLGGVDESTDILTHLLEVYPEFESMLTEEAAAFQEEAKRILA